jgi:putative molybdopterin biosynthesis protein
MHFAMYTIVQYDKSMKKESFYTAKELADILKMGVVTIYRKIRSGKLKAYKIGREFRIDKAEFEKFLNKNKTNR